MKVNFFSSLGAKLFYYMSLLVLITVAGNSYQYVMTFLKVQTEEVQDKIITQASQAGSQVESQIRTWRSQVAVSLPTLRAIDAKDANTPSQRFIDSSPDFISLQLFSAPHAKSHDFSLLSEAFTSRESDTRFEDKVPKQTWNRIQAISKRFLKREITNVNRDNFSVDSISKSLGLPVMIMAARFDVADSKQVVWAVLSTWQDPIIKALPKSSFVTSALVDNKGKVFASIERNDMLMRKIYPGIPLVKAALKAKEPSGFVDEYRNTNDQRRLGAYHRIPGTELTVLVEQDAEHAYTELKKNLLATALWSLLFILIAVMFSFVGAASITKGIRTVTEATLRIASGDLHVRIKPQTRDEVALLSASVNHMSGRIIELMKSQVEKARFEKELETARIVQGTFFPKGDIQSGPVSVSGFYQPASECGGDLWGHFTIDDGVEFVYIADAMGHGAPAALVTAMAYSTAMTIADIFKDKSSDLRDSPAKVLERANRIIYEAVRGSISMTFFASVLDTKRGTLTFANAGHNFPVVLPAQANDPRAGKPSKALSKISNINPISLKLMGTPLGMDPATTYKEQTIDLKAGDKIFYFTDGLIECSAPNGSVWGRKTLLEQLVDMTTLKGDQLKGEIVKRAFGFFANKPIDDDVTVVVAELAKDWQPQTASNPHSAPQTAGVTPTAQQTLEDDVLLLATVESPITPTLAPAEASKEAPQLKPAEKREDPRATTPGQRYKIKLPSAS